MVVENAIADAGGKTTQGERALSQSESDLMAIVDFCNEAAGVGAQEVIRDAHDIMHVLLGGDRTRAWCWMSDWLDLYTPRNCTQAWPDVRIRMTEAFKKAGGKRCNGGERVTHEVPLGPERKRNR